MLSQKLIILEDDKQHLYESPRYAYSHFSLMTEVLDATIVHRPCVWRNYYIFFNCVN